MRILLLCLFPFVIAAQDGGFLLSDVMRGKAKSSSDKTCDDDRSKKRCSSSSSSSCFSFFNLFYTNDDDDYYDSSDYSHSYDTPWDNVVIAPVFAYTNFHGHEIDHIHQGGFSVGLAAEDFEISLLYLSGPITFSEQSLSQQSTDNASSSDFALQARVFLDDNLWRPFFGFGISAGMTAWDYQQAVFLDDPIHSDYVRHHSVYLGLGLSYRIEEKFHFSCEIQSHDMAFNELTDAGFVNDVFGYTNAVRYVAGLNIHF